MLTRYNNIKRAIISFFQRLFRGYSNEETWQLNTTFIKWLDPRIRLFYNESNEVIDWDGSIHKTFKLPIDNKSYSFIEAVELIISLLDKYMILDDRINELLKQNLKVNETTLIEELSDNYEEQDTLMKNIIMIYGQIGYYLDW